MSDVDFRAVVGHLEHGDFSALDPVFAEGRIQEWVDEGLFDTEPEALNEALTCACFNGRTEVAEFLLDRGVDPTKGNKTGLDALHWAVNRGQLTTVQFLIERSVPLETINMYGGTALRGAIWSSLYESRPEHPAIIEALVEAGADLEAARGPDYDERIDEVLRKYVTKA
jgi:ankyrin repeat protein